MQSLELSSPHCIQVLLPIYCAHIYPKSAVYWRQCQLPLKIYKFKITWDMFQDHQHPGYATSSVSSPSCVYISSSFIPLTLISTVVAILLEFDVKSNTIANIKPTISQGHFGCKMKFGSDLGMTLAKFYWSGTLRNSWQTNIVWKQISVEYTS